MQPSSSALSVKTAEHAVVAALRLVPEPVHISSLSGAQAWSMPLPVETPSLLDRWNHPYGPAPAFPPAPANGPTVRIVLGEMKTLHRPVYGESRPFVYDEYPPVL